ncbi:hypothetical protein [Ensifer sp. LCM 4579]|uniref:hypothetical protein n=1 Tax=Ensifer sp. LCM 4579 TaxID=1848292 RepID=UPI0008DB2968|nr:hypothetical protein [Ensifer sp. LCM 4579]OHV80121.1 hypothetical protein LCM4579_23375 [Ensifer sp. LCM 4579]
MRPIEEISDEDKSEYIKALVGAEAENLMQIVICLTRTNRSQDFELLLYVLGVLRLACKDPAAVEEQLSGRPLV